MTALTAPRNTPARAGDLIALLLAANTTIQAGSIVAISAGYAVPGSTATSLVAVGRAEDSATAVAAGDAAIRVRGGTFRFENSSTDPIAQANVGTDCYIVDDQTVAATSGTNTRSRAGIVIEVDDEGVWVQIGLGL